MTLKLPNFVKRWLHQSGAFKTISVLFFVSMILLIGALYAMYRHNTVVSSSVPTTSTSSYVRDVFEKSYYRADGIAPTIIRIDDAKKLQTSNKEFYKNAENGDYLIVYPDKAFLYRLPSQKIISISDMVQANEFKP